MPEGQIMQWHMVDDADVALITLDFVFRLHHDAIVLPPHDSECWGYRLQVRSQTEPLFDDLGYTFTLCSCFDTLP